MMTLLKQGVPVQDEFENVVLNALSEDLINQQGVSLQQALDQVRHVLPKEAILVGQNIGKDVQWLELKEGSDFQALLDLAGIYRTWNPRFKSWSVFGQDHVAKLLLNQDVSGSHDAVGDATKSIRLFKLSQQLKQDPRNWEQAQQKLLQTPPEPSFAKKNPSFDGVCMGNRKTCQCGAPFLG